MVDGERTVACPFCGDTGFVECWRRNLIDKMSVACSCKAGDGPAGKWFGCNERGREVQRYDPRLCYRVGDKSDYWLGIRSRVEADIARESGRMIAERSF